jgi:myo-inositol 2-dehydrogenase / D-chiro-inositol 1-dehydrogenase
MAANDVNAAAPSRRALLKNTLGVGLIAGFPTIVPARVFGRSAPSNLIQVGQIGCGRIARGSEMAGILKNSAAARYVAVCDLDQVRLADGKRKIEAAYAKQLGTGNYTGLKSYADYKELLADKSIDAVCISTPDHWHAQPAMEAAFAGKDIYLQKPASLTIEEGRHLSDTIKRTNRILQIGSQQRSTEQFRFACELVRNGRLGQLREVYIGLPVDPAGPEQPKMPVPANLNYAEWLGSTPEVYYTEERVHPQTADEKRRYDRPGWLRCEQFGAGMITGWGAHHIDTAHLAMDTEYSGPLEVEATAEFPKSGLWDVHGPFHVKAQYPNGVMVYISDKYPTGVKFLGDDGWLWVTRGEYQPGSLGPGKKRSAVLDASNLAWLAEGIRDNEIHLHKSPNNDHHLDWLTSIKSREQPVAPAEVGHRSCTACLVAHASMKLGRPVKWDPKTEHYPGDETANKLISRLQRAPYGTKYVLEQHSA